MIFGIDASQANRKIRSGTEWYAYYLISEFKQLLASRPEITVRLYTREPLQADLTKDLPANFAVRVLRWPLPYFWAQGRLSLEMLLNPPDVLFCPAHTIPLIHPSHKGRGILSRFRPPRWGRSGGGRTFTTLHDVGFEDHPELYDRLSLWYHKFSARLAVKQAYHIFTISEFSKQRIMEVYNCPADKLTVTHLGLEQKFRPAAADAKIDTEKILSEYNLQPDNYFLFIGRLEPKKNIMNIVRGFEITRTDKQLVLAGRRVRIAEVDEYLQANPDLGKRVKFLDYFDEADKPALYQGAAIFLFPTLYEGFGLPILEAQSCGTPVITSLGGSHEEVAGDGAVMIDPESPMEISHAIETILQNTGLREQIIREGLRNIDRFSWAETAKQTLQIILDQGSYQKS